MRILLLLCLALPALGLHVEQQIVDGGIATIGGNAHQLSLRVNGLHECGASLISATRAVTSAQCTGQAIGVYSILGGTADRTSTTCATCVVRDLFFLSRHPDFDDNANAGYPSDVSVVGFSDVTLGDNLAAILLAAPGDGDFAGASCTTTGWGESAPADGFPNVLRRAALDVLSNTECEASYTEFAIGASHVCAFGDGLRGICNGDFGGPLDCGDILVGIASWVEASCSTSYPSVYSRVSASYDWILEQ
jgi:trypsin